MHICLYICSRTFVYRQYVYGMYVVWQWDLVEKIMSDGVTLVCIVEFGPQYCVPFPDIFSQVCHLETLQFRLILFSSDLVECWAFGDFWSVLRVRRPSACFSIVFCAELFSTLDFCFSFVCFSSVIYLNVFSTYLILFKPSTYAKLIG